MSPTARILLEYLPPAKAEEMMARFHAALQHALQSREINEELNMLHRELHKLAQKYSHRFAN